MRVALVIGLGIEIFRTVSWLAARLPMAGAYELSTLAMIGVRCGVTAFQAAAVYSLVRRSPGAGRLAVTAFVLAAVTPTVELGAYLTPSNVFPAHRWPLITTYWAYALICSWAAHRLHRF
jgi:hypothetical protein